MVAEMDVETLEREALRLSPEDRARLATDLLESLDELPAENLDQVWLQEGARRAVRIG